MGEPVWLSPGLIEAIHQRQLSEHGGLAGVRDRAMLESAAERARQQFAYRSVSTDFPELAAAYAFGLSRNHPFMDGNKRTSAVICELFLQLNGYQLLATDVDLYPVFLALAAGELEEDQLIDWLRAHSRPLGVN
ncbi:MAG: type II toxin-antitoxin system death-on-curing family toxin, partial [Pseudomonadota bacterium]